MAQPAGASSTTSIMIAAPAAREPFELAPTRKYNPKIAPPQSSPASMEADVLLVFTDDDATKMDDQASISVANE